MLGHLKINRKLLLYMQLEELYQVDPASSWMLAAAQKNLPLFVPGWEDSTMGNMFAGEIIVGKINNAQMMKSGIEYMVELARWYVVQSRCRREKSDLTCSGRRTNTRPRAINWRLEPIKESWILWSQQIKPWMH